MKIGRSLFKSKVARRIFFLFVCCALLPITILSVISFIQVSNELEDQSATRLQRAAKAHGTSIFERFVFLETDLLLISSILPAKTSEFNFSELSEEFHDIVFRRFKSVTIVPGSGNPSHLYGQLSGIDIEKLRNYEPANFDKISILIHQLPESPARIFMIKWIAPQTPNYALIAGEVDTTYLWGIGHGNTLPPLTDFCIVDQNRKVLITSFPVADSLLHQTTFSNTSTNLRWFEYEDDEGAYFVSQWPMFLKSRFVSPSLMVVLRSDKSAIFAPLLHFKKIYPLVVLLSLWIVVLLSIAYIRRSLIPLEKLKEGTLRVAEKDFKSQVSVTSGDEFEDLAMSFNTMSGQLDQHFNALIARSEIDRAILSSFRTKRVVETALKRIHDFMGCDAISLGILRSKQPDSLHTHILHNVNDNTATEEFLKISPEDTREFVKNPDYTLIELNTFSPHYLSPNVVKDMAMAVVLPLFLNDTLSGIMAIFHQEKKSYGADDLNHARQLSNQVSVALSNAYLIEDLETLNWGTLEALARTVDAKSAWTAGHSERVATIAVKIAQVLGCSQKEIDTLQRAAFLHDIGKIGVPLSILDKPSKLNDEEYEIVKEHPSIGAKILEPIEAYADAIPIVLQHHEKFNGRGYPAGIAAEDISLGARILAVADVYDAVASDRPYRSGWVEEKAIKLITENSGKDFDPKVVEAFLSIPR